MQIAEGWTGGWIVALCALGGLLMPAPHRKPALVVTVPSSSEDADHQQIGKMLDNLDAASAEARRLIESARDEQLIATAREELESSEERLRSKADIFYANDPYMQVFAHARKQFDRCFDGQIMGVDLLVTIAADGHVTNASNRPDPSTPTSRCISRVVSRLTFPRAETMVAIRVPIMMTGYR